MFARRPAPPRPRIDYETLTATPPDQLAARMAGPPEEGAPWVEAAAKYGMAEAQVLWGQMKLDGLGTGRDEAEALEWFRSAAKGGSAAAMNMLGRCHELGRAVAVDYEEAVHWFRASAEKGFDWGQYNYANMLWRGDGVARDVAAALHWYRQAAAQGHAKSINMVGRFLEEGWETERDPVEAARLYRLSAERGDFRGQYNLAALLTAQGQVEEAARWFREAARLAHDGFRRTMVPALAARPEPELRAIAHEIATGLAREAG